jgi:hypothetical protein
MVRFTSSEFWVSARYKAAKNVPNKTAENARVLVGRKYNTIEKVVRKTWQPHPKYFLVSSYPFGWLRHNRK